MSAEKDPVDEAFDEWIRGEGGAVVIERFRDSLKLAFISGMKALSEIHQADMDELSSFSAEP